MILPNSIKLYIFYRPLPHESRAMPKKRFWLFKTEPSEFGIDDLANSPDQTTSWTGIRNYTARNFLRDEVRVGDSVFIYHSSAKRKGVVGIARVVRAGYSDHSAFDPKSDYYDPKASPEDPIWVAVDVRLVERFSDVVELGQLKQTRELENMMLCQRGARLSIQPVTATEWDIICRLGTEK
jgi:predicted RNA-binding protein with PUA-like domain